VNPQKPLESIFGFCSFAVFLTELDVLNVELQICASLVAITVGFLALRDRWKKRRK
jgi:hypothetical protein